jgi:hypothetical protein
VSWQEVAVNAVHAAQVVLLAAIGVWAQKTRQSTRATREDVAQLLRETGGPRPPASRSVH